ncbi:MAG: hypothetical protein ABJA34_00485 [Pseudonocardiales bacterium]
MGRHRLLVAVAGAIGLLLSLSGCVKLDMDLTIRSNDTVEGTIILAVNKRLLTASGQGEQQLHDQLEKQGPFAAAERPKEGTFSQRPYDKDGRVGEAYTFSGVPLTEFGNSGTGLKITHTGDRYFVSGQLDLTTQSATDPQTEALAKQFGSTPELRIKMTFPGEVLTSNGTINGRSVTWHPKLGQRTLLSAEARTTAVIPKLLAIAGGVVGLLLVIGLVVLLVLRRRRRVREAYAGQPAYAPAGYGGYDPSPAQQQEAYGPGQGQYGAPYAAPSQSEGWAWPAPPSPEASGVSPADRTQQLPVVDPARPVPPDEPGPR